MSELRTENDRVPDEGWQVLRRKMAIQQRIELEMNNLIRGMVALVDDSQVANSAMEKAQLKNLLGMALDTQSVEAIKVYVRYQVGRDTAGLSWREKGFGARLVDEISKLLSTARNITEQTYRELQLSEPDEQEVNDTWLLLTRAYLGQLNRYFYYRKEATRWPPETS